MCTLDHGRCGHSHGEAVHELDFDEQNDNFDSFLLLQLCIYSWPPHVLMGQHLHFDDYWVSFVQLIDHVITELWGENNSASPQEASVM